MRQFTLAALTVLLFAAPAVAAQDVAFFPGATGESISVDSTLSIVWNLVALDANNVGLMLRSLAEEAAYDDADGSLEPLSDAEIRRGLVEASQIASGVVSATNVALYTFMTESVRNGTAADEEVLAAAEALVNISMEVAAAVADGSEAEPPLSAEPRNRWLSLSEAIYDASSKLTLTTMGIAVEQLEE